jgi:hypothetical protein
LDVVSIFLILATFSENKSDDMGRRFPTSNLETYLTAVIKLRNILLVNTLNATTYLPNCSPSSNVSGSLQFFVSGRKEITAAPTREQQPKIRGGQKSPKDP